MTVLDPTTGYPSVGRLRCSLEEIKAEFVDHPRFAQSATRCSVWEDFETALSLLSGGVLVHAVWLAGSFVSSKLDPNDIDAVFVINARNLAARSEADRKVVASFSERTCDPLGNVVRAHGLKVDSFLLQWAPIPEVDLQGDLSHVQYVASRGYWDDFWCRNRNGQKHHPPTWRDALPARGYLEVIVHAFTR